jgi:lipoprotein signal peptidase
VRTGIFNVADMAITTGAILLLASAWFSRGNARG